MMSMFWSLMAADAAAEAAVCAGVGVGEARAGRRATDVDLRLDRALLACEAMWSLVRDKLALSDDELVQRFNDLDLTDGQLDGKVRKTPVSCPKCGRAMSR